MSRIISVNIPKAFTDADGTRIPGGIRQAEEETVARWVREGKARELSPGPVRPQKPAADPEPVQPAVTRIIHHKRKPKPAAPEAPAKPVQTPPARRRRTSKEKQH